jgi:hypothetical protein
MRWHLSSKTLTTLLLSRNLAAVPAAELATVETKTEENHQQEVESDGDLGDFDDEEADFNPFEYEGVEYHRDEDDNLYTSEGDLWGYLDDENRVLEGERPE